MTDAPTPCKPPEILYAPPPNFPPAWSLVMVSSSAETPVFFCFSTGIPRPLSLTVAEPSLLRVTQTVLQTPAKLSSTELSTISLRHSWSPLLSVEPIYIPGLFLTGSSPSRTWICSAVYAFASAIRRSCYLIYFTLASAFSKAKMTSARGSKQGWYSNLSIEERCFHWL